jgi:hypothetical protein
MACAAASVAVGFVRHHQRQQELIKITAIVQLAAGINKSFSNFSLSLSMLCLYNNTPPRAVVYNI